MKKKYEARFPVPPEEFYSEFTYKEEDIKKTEGGGENGLKSM